MPGAPQVCARKWETGLCFVFVLVVQISFMRLVLFKTSFRILSDVLEFFSEIHGKREAVIKKSMFESME
jgi:hypothetical protein